MAQSSKLLSAEEEQLNSEKAKADAIAFAEAHLAAVAFIEKHLFEPMDVRTIAHKSGYSPSEFSRRFTRLQGESVMAYLRGRRLEGAMRRILAEPNARIVDLAFDCGFDSQEAFTRAFARAFGETPGRLQRSRPAQALGRKRKTSIEEPIIRERIVQLSEIRLAGLCAHFIEETYVEMPPLWQKMAKLTGIDRQPEGRETYGVRLRSNPDDGSFDFLAAIRIDPDYVPPKPLEVLSLPARTYLVLRHILREGDLYPQMVAAEEAIRSKRLPRSGRALMDAPWFQVYPANLRMSDGWIDNYLPVVS